MEPPSHPLQCQYRLSRDREEEKAHSDSKADFGRDWDETIDRQHRENVSAAAARKENTGQTRGLRYNRRSLTGKGGDRLYKGFRARQKIHPETSMARLAQGLWQDTSPWGIRLQIRIINGEGVLKALSTFRRQAGLEEVKG